MITDDREHFRKLGLGKIFKARHTSTTRYAQQYRLPTVNFVSSESQTTRKWLIGLQNVLQNPLTSDISEKDLMKYIKHKNAPAIELENYPCHTQAVARCVKLVSDAAGAVCGQKQRIGFTRTRISSR